MARFATAEPTPAPAAAKTTPAIVHVRVEAGLARTRDVDGVPHWLVRSGGFSFEVGSAIPATSIVVSNGGPDGDRKIPGKPVAIRPVGDGIAAGDFQSTQRIAVLAIDPDHVDDVRRCTLAEDAQSPLPAGCDAAPVDLVDWDIDGVDQPLPQAMWGAPVAPREPPPPNADSPTVPGTIGISMRPVQPPPTDCTPEMKIDVVFEDRVVNADDARRLPISDAQEPAGPTPAPADSFADIAHINDPGVSARRGDLFAALALIGVNPWTNEPLPAMASAPGASFADEPMEEHTIGAPA
jgi:hypothetical protein